MEVDSLEENKQLFFQSCKDGSLATVQQLLTHSDLRAHIDSLTDDGGNTALIVASENGHKGIVKLLLECGVNVDKRTPNGWTALMKASERGDSNLEVIELLLRHGAQADLQNNEGDSALIVATQNGQTVLVIKLVRDHRANVDLKNKKGWTALMKASLVGCVEMVELLLNHGAQVDQQNSNGETALMIASQNGHIKIVKLLLKFRAKVDIKANDSKTALVLASQQKHTEAVELLLEYGAKDDLDIALACVAAIKEVHINTIKLLLEHGAKPDYRLFLAPTALEGACGNGRMDIVKLLLDNGSHEYLGSAMAIAIRNGHIDVVKVLLDRGSYSEEDLGWTLVEAILNKHDDIVELLLKHGAQVNEDFWPDVLDQPPLAEAVEKGDVDIVKLLLEHGAKQGLGWAITEAIMNEYAEIIQLLLQYGALEDDSCDRDPPLIEASANGNIAVVKLLLDKGAQVDITNTEKETALMIASQNGHTDVVKLLLDKGAQVDIANTDGSTALMIASQNGHTDVVKLFLDKGAQVDIANTNGWTALMIASQNGHTDVVKLFLDKGAQVDIANTNGWTALMIASQNGHTDVVKLLLDKGAQVDIANTNGWTALMIASQNGHTDVVKLLLDKGAQVDIANNTNGGTALTIASQNGHTDVVKMLLDKGAHINIAETDGWTALMIASQHNHINVVKLLLDKGAQVDIVKDDGQTALMIASQDGQRHIVKLLLDKDPQLDMQDSEGATALLLASQNGHANVVRLLLKKSAQVNIQDNNGTTALIFAADHGHADVVQLLLKRGANVDIQNHDGFTALMRASENGYTDIVKLLLNKGSKVDTQCDDGYCALIAASQNGHADIVKLLLPVNGKFHGDIQKRIGITALNKASHNGHADVVNLLLDIDEDIANANDTDEQTALMTASQHGRTDVVKLLLDKGAQADIAYSNGWTALMIASQGGYKDVVKLLLDKGAQIDIVETDGSTALMRASQNGHTDVVKLLLDKGAQVDIANTDGWTALMIASQNGHTDVVKLFLDKGAQVDIANTNGSTALMIASQGGYKDVVKLLLDKGAQVDIANNTNGGTALTIASQNGHTDVVKMLLDKGAHINIAETDGWTALMIASQNNHINVVKLLLDKGAQVDIVKDDGQTALMIASQDGQRHIVKLLLDKDPQLDMQDSEGATALLLASQNGHANVVRLLLKKSAQVNIQDNNGATALILAANNGHEDVVRLLLKRGANVDIQDHDGVTALMRASNSGHTDIVKLLLNKGSKVDTQCDNGYCALIAASEKGHADVVKLLLQIVHGDIPESIGINALEVASHNGYEDVVKLLLDDLTCVSDAALYYATIHGHSSVVKLLQDKKDYHASEQELLAAVELAIKNGGEINHLLLHGVFVGPPRSGKDSLMKRLMGEMPSDTSPSTGAAEQVVHVIVEKSFTTAATIEDSKWIRLKYDEEAIQLIKTASSKNVAVINKQSCANLTDPETDSSVLDEGRSNSEQQNQGSNALNISEIFEEQISIPHPTSKMYSSEPEVVQEMSVQRKHKTPMEIFKEAIKNEGMEGLKKHLADRQLLYLTNTGGQMEFQELLPLLVSGPSVFFITFQLHKSITETFSVVYELPSGELSKSYQSSLNVLETILQTLSSIAAMGTYVYKGLQRKAVPLQPKVFIIGTHKDMLDKKSADTVIKSIDKHLQKVIRSTSHYREELIQCASESQMIFAVNNHDPDDKDFQRIRSAVENLAGTGDYQMRSPAHWMVFSLVLRQLQNRVEHYNKCYQIAKECGIKDEKEFNEALHFIHTRMGLIRYFPHEELKDLVIIDPQILFEKVTELIVETFTFKNFGNLSKPEIFKNMGIFNLIDFERISSRTGQNLTPTLFAKLLEHLRIAAPFQQDGIKKYFLSCALTHAQVKQNVNNISTIPQLIVTFQCGYCPKGLFGTLITYLINNEMQSEFEWELVTEKIYRDEVCFQVGPYDTVTLRFLPTHLEITYIESNPNLPRINCPEEDICQEVCQSLEKGIKIVTSAINYINAQYSFTFYCTAESCSKELHPAKLKKHRGKLCSLKCDKLNNKSFPLPSGFEKWQLDSSPQVFEPTKTTTSTSQPTESDIRLEKHHHTLLFGQLSGHASKWREIGIYLGFLNNELENIETKPSLYHGGQKSFLCEMLFEWLEWAPGDKRESKEYATLEALKTAVSSAGLGATAANLTISGATTGSTMAESRTTTSRDHDLSLSASTSAMKSGNKRNQESTEEPHPKRSRLE